MRHLGLHGIGELNQKLPIILMVVSFLSDIRMHSKREKLESKKK